MDVPAPPRGTRPRNRREQIRAAATVLFHERGYEQVSMADVASAVNIGPSALYRHYGGKSELLCDAIEEAIRAFAALVVELPARTVLGVAEAGARAAMQHRALGVLWQREARNLTPAQQLRLRGQLREAAGILASALWGIRPDLDEADAAFLAATAVNAMGSLSFHRLVVADDVLEPLLTQMLVRVIKHRFTDEPRQGRRPASSLAPEAEDGSGSERDRRTQIARAAVALFATHGFEAVSVDDIGAAVGMAGPSVYHHYASKQEILYEALGQGYNLLQEAMAHGTRPSETARQRLRRVSDSYVDLSLDRTDLITALLAESRNLAPEHAGLARLAQLGYIGQWVDLVRAVRPDEDLTAARIKVQAAQITASSTSRTWHLRTRPALREDLREICWSLLR